jgi:hypothetical protein
MSHGDLPVQPTKQELRTSFNVALFEDTLLTEENGVDATEKAEIEQLANEAQALETQYAEGGFTEEELQELGDLALELENKVYSALSEEARADSDVQKMLSEFCGMCYEKFAEEAVAETATSHKM